MFIENDTRTNICFSTKRLQLLYMSIFAVIASLKAIRSLLASLCNSFSSLK